MFFWSCKLPARVSALLLYSPATGAPLCYQGPSGCRNIFGHKIYAYPCLLLAFAPFQSDAYEKMFLGMKVAVGVETYLR